MSGRNLQQRRALRRFSRRLQTITRWLHSAARAAEEIGLRRTAADLTRQAQEIGALRLAVDLELDEATKQPAQQA